jgi:DNA-binding XRE family transcriptional regulator
MKTKNSVRILPDSNGEPLYVIMPYDTYVAISSRQKAAPPLPKTVKTSRESAIPPEVARRVNQDGITLVRAWREHLGLTQKQVADRLKVTQGAYALTEKRDNPRPTTLARIARAMRLDISQLDPE